MEEKQALKCPRCDSTNTKFCYYNNYTKSQPRHYCRSCKKHWTNGGTFRNLTKNKKVSKRNTTSKRKKKKVGGPKVKFDEGLRQKMDDTQAVNHQKDASFGGISTGFDQSHDLFDNLGCSEDVGMKGEIVGLECSSLFDHEMFSFQQLPRVSDKDLRWEDLLLYESFCVTDLLTFDEDVPEVNSAMDLKNEQH